MRQWIPRAGSALLTIALLSACSDTRLKTLAIGISSDSVVALMKAAPHTDATYLASGRKWEVELFARHDEHPGDSVRWRDMSPVVLADGKTVGWGWSWWEKESAKLGFAPVPK